MVVLKRLVGTLFWPNQTFADVDREPSWVAPVIIAMLVAFFSAFVFNQRITVDWDRLIRDRYESAGRAEPPAEVVQQQAGVAQKVFRYGPLINALVTPLFYFVLAALFAVGLTLMEAQTTYKKILAVVAWSSCGVGIVAEIVMTTVLLLRPAADIDPTRPDSVMVTSPEFLLSANAAPALRAFASSFDVFTIYFLVLLVIGFAQIGGSAKITKTSATVLVLVEWMIWIGLKVGWVAVFGG